MTYPVWKWSPDWAAGVVERISWQTAIDTSQDGTEYRHRMRADTRTAIEFSTLVSGEDSQEMVMEILAHQSSHWLMPVWWDASRLDVSTAPAIVFDSTGRDFGRSGVFSWAVLVDGDFERFEAIEIAYDSLGGFWALKDPIDPVEWPVGSKIYPARVVQLSQTQGLSHHTAQVTTLGVECRVVDNANWPAAPDASYLETLEPNRIRPVSSTLDRLVGEADFNVGPFTLTDYGGTAFRTVVHDYLCSSREELTAIRGALSFLAGRLGELRLPTFQADLRSMFDVDFLNYPYIYASPVGFMDLFDGGAVAPALYIKPTRSGYAPIIAEVDGVQSNDVNSEEIEFDPPLPVTFKKNEVKISLVYKSRLSSDTIEINHITPEVAQISIGYRSLK